MLTTDAHTLGRERLVGAAVVFDPDLPGPGIITERDILVVAGEDGDLDAELVHDHLPRTSSTRRPSGRSSELPRR